MGAARGPGGPFLCNHCGLVHFGACREERKNMDTKRHCGWCHRSTQQYIAGAALAWFCRRCGRGTC